MDRRGFLAFLGLLAGSGFHAAAAEAGPAEPAPSPQRVVSPQRVLPLWPDEPPGGGGPRGEARRDRRGAVRQLARPTLTLFRPDRPSGTAVLIASGGGYRRIEDGKEALPAARWLAARGHAAAVLDYRLPGEGWGAGPAAPLQDARRALGLLHAGAAGPDIRRIGVLGFSSGAHLMALAAGAVPMGAYPAVDAADTTPARADFAALIYPVLDLGDGMRPTSAQRRMVGRHPPPERAAAWSATTYVDARYPPTFLVQAADDPVSDPRQAPLMAQACARAGVPAELHVLASGGHGFGMGEPGTDAAQWAGWLAAFIAGLPR
ncbi:alpha/beta hydrolase [Ancylobacter oerskovii]|uniref:Alpha/beta hydrolase n=1 Tax=Ancylobacter oerskovii TaxID=459519 RepID=A0ABW4YU15_9HYPH|nr:alpha/beta hydrolase [Ancylobacter oerskovii]MBS7543735.1 alpha/beta hydrolase [Ancylobacter oerskovii]